MEDANKTIFYSRDCLKPDIVLALRFDSLEAFFSDS